MSDGRWQGLPTAAGRALNHDLFSEGKPVRHANKKSEGIMNTIIYIVGLVVIIGFILSYFGFR